MMLYSAFPLLFFSCLRVVFPLLNDASDSPLVVLPLLNDVSDLPLDAASRVASHWLVIQSSDNCEQRVRNVYDRVKQSDSRLISGVSDSFERKLFGNTDKCSVMLIERGSHLDHIASPMQSKRYIVTDKASESGLAAWLKVIDRTEIGFVNYMLTPSGAKATGTIFWLNHEGRRLRVGNLLYGEKNTNWQTSYLGHVFEIVGDATGELWGRFSVDYNSCFVLGKQKSAVDRSRNFTHQITDAMNGEYQRSRTTKRSFTAMGFQKGRLPDELWSSINTYYYNNMHNLAREEWESKGFYVNWWIVDVYMIGIPFELKRTWQNSLKDLVQRWIEGDSGLSLPLELTDIYGMRRYEAGASLLSHVDRQTTHATSMIINIAQSNVQKPWAIEVYDHDDRLHEVTMKPGDIIYYESAKALHSRVRPLDSGYYVNMFSHYRPKGEPNWAFKTNPPGTPAACTEANPTACGPGMLDTLVQPVERVTGGKDLTDRWADLTGYNKIKGYPDVNHASTHALDL